MTPLPPKYSLTIWRDATFQKVITYYKGSTVASGPMDLTGYTASLVVRNPGQRNSILTLSDVPELVLGGAAGTIVITIPAATTKALEWTSGNYELLVDNGLIVTPLLRGVIRVKGL